MYVSDILEDKHRHIITVQATESFKKAIARLNQEHIGAMVVVNAENHLVGILSERDLIKVLAEYGQRALQANVGALMSDRVYICKPQDRLQDVMSWMVHCRVRHLPVVEEGKVQGIISIGDVLKHLLEENHTEPTVKEGIVVV